MARHLSNPGLGTDSRRRLVEHFGGAEAALRASLTELESTGLQAVSAQSLASGNSAELAREQMARASDADVTLLSLDDPGYPAHPKAPGFAARRADRRFERRTDFRVPSRHVCLPTDLPYSQPDR